MTHVAPKLDIELYDETLLIDPFEAFRRIRDAGPAVHLTRYGDVYAIGRYQDVRAALANPTVFSSARGVSLNPGTNERLAGTTLGSDDPGHARLRSIVSRPLAPDRLAELRSSMAASAEALVVRLVEQGTFDAVADMATHLPLTVVAELVGMPVEGRDRMLDWAAAAFNSMGPADSRLTIDALPIAAEMAHYAFDPALAAKVAPGSWADQLFAAEARGEITRAECGSLLTDYMAPALDTTIFAGSSAIWLFANHPDQWAWLRQNPEKLPQALNEILRLEGPVQQFSRYVTREVDVGGVTIPEGARALMMFASANRDERKWETPEKFDLQRRAGDHLAFGHAVHTCMGMNLAKLEVTALLTALLPRVERFELAGEPRRVPNNSLRGFAHLPVRVQ
ncbi:cytochrome P450 [Mesorhizobium waimense]|uniref:Cytochrome P450 n=1 Tax=Mesorhizobium waimense TaxID=1300307 RepID=A0A3A5L5U6_9HYPH|nr:cytochrome P450 [Mesorhizobium waimense]RJT41448.1 cytochrome P450 [Mesorhizobium waimense]